MQISAIALQGLHQAQSEVEQAGARIASLGADSGQTGAVDSASLSDTAVALLAGKNQFATDLNLIKVGEEVHKQTIHLLA
ncbi:MAG TPA: hypothetical protein VKU19_02565 [Bryobacteraceae bacterium]|nr:hypothetical protein [Bryobacteraceae bacterium]